MCECGMGHVAAVDVLRWSLSAQAWVLRVAVSGANFHSSDSHNLLNFMMAL